MHIFIHTTPGGAAEFGDTTPWANAFAVASPRTCHSALQSADPEPADPAHTHTHTETHASTRWRERSRVLHLQPNTHQPRTHRPHTHQPNVHIATSRPSVVERQKENERQNERKRVSEADPVLTATAGGGWGGGTEGGCGVGWGGGVAKGETCCAESSESNKQCSLKSLKSVTDSAGATSVEERLRVVRLHIARGQRLAHPADNAQEVCARAGQVDKTRGEDVTSSKCE